MTTKPKLKAPALGDPIFAAIAEHKMLNMEFIRCRNASEAARAKAEKKHRKSLEGKALYEAAAEDTKLEYDQFCLAERAARKAGLRMARKAPSTPAGAGAMIAHVEREITRDYESARDWAGIALKTAAVALGQMETAR